MKLFKHRVLLGALVLGSLIPLTFAAGVVAAGPPAVGLGTADTYAVLAGDSITNTGATTLYGDLGLHPGTVVDSGITVNGASNVNNSAALIAKNDLRTAYLDAEGRPSPILITAGALGGQTLVPGLYKDDGAPNSLGIAAGQTLTLAGDASSVWIFQSASTLITEVGARVELTGGALACNVFWQVGKLCDLEDGKRLRGDDHGAHEHYGAEQRHGRRQTPRRSLAERRGRADARHQHDHQDPLPDCCRGRRCSGSRSGSGSRSDADAGADHHHHHDPDDDGACPCWSGPRRGPPSGGPWQRRLATAACAGRLRLPAAPPARLRRVVRPCRRSILPRSPARTTEWVSA